MQTQKILKKDFKKYLVLKNLKNLSDCPLSIYALGNLKLLELETVTIVGSRKISSYGEQVIKEIVPILAQNGICVVSGVAYGCDYFAQKSAVDSGGTTIGIIGCGINKITTHQHYLFIKHCLDKNVGLFLSEFEPDMQAAKWTFIKRDRIMACLGDKLVVIEAAQKSGTMHTVNFALELGKEVYAVPGNIYNSNSIGTNILIQNGANVLLSAQDLLQDYSVNDTNKSNQPFSKTETAILHVLDDEKTALEVSRLTDISVANVLSDLTVLEMKGIIKQVGGKWSSLCRS